VTRRVLLLALVVALPTVGLGAGWLTATRREHASAERERTQRLMRASDAVRAAVDESLEELRVREDRRPFYLYNHYYSPPEVQAVSDPVATSPLSRDPNDPRLVGHFQIDPDGSVRTPYTRERGDGAHPRARRIVASVADAPFAPLRALSRPSPEPTLLAYLPPAPMNPAIDLGPRPPPYRPSPSREDVPTGPLTTGLNAWSNAVYDEIQAAQAGSVEAENRLRSRGRQVPLTRRNPVSWTNYGQLEGNIQAPLSQRPAAMPQRAPEPASQQATRAVPQQAEGTTEEPAAQEAERARRERAARRRAERAQREWEARRAALEARDDALCGATDVACAPEAERLASQRDADVLYTSMAWRRVGDDLVLHRLVEHQGAAVVQGALLDVPHLRDEWVRDLVARHGTAVVGGVEVTPRVVGRDDDAACAVRGRASEVLPLDLCFPPTALERAAALQTADLRVQSGLLLGLLAMIGIAVVMIVRAARRSDELSRQKSAFVSAVSHELRTPLTAIRMHSEMLAEGMVAEAREPKVYGELVQESVRLGRLVENVLELSRLEEGRRALRLATCDLRAHLRGLVDAQRPFVERKGVTLVGPTPGPPVVREVDTQAIEQIVLNLLDNAVKYGRSERNEVRLEVLEEPDGAVIEVRDHGSGIPEGERAKVFERFHRVERSDDAHMPGTGIGLALVEELVHAHGGEAHIDDAPGGGARVRVVLP